jgi:hypothetical protein
MDAWLASRLGPFTPGKQHRYPLNRRLDGLQSRSGRIREEKKSVALTGIETPDRQDATPAPLILSYHIL